MGAILGIANDYIGVMIIGLVLIPVGLVWLILAARFVNVQKIDDRLSGSKELIANTLGRCRRGPGSSCKHSLASVLNKLNLPSRT